ncbi:MAG: electron transfer flavoprotein subunit alpha [Oligoflexia bacterium]|nr:electron transfer flavoprotein subunit alpha [Oligoflexia bacterium]
MEKILYLAHTDSNGSLPKPALEALTAAMELSKKLGGASLSVGLIGASIDAAAQAIGGCGAAKLYGAAGAELGVSRYSTDAAAAEALAKAAGATLIVAPGTTRFARAIPGVTARLGGRIDTRVTGLLAEGNTLKVQRWYYRQRMMSTQSRAQRPWVLLVDSGVFPAYSGPASSPSVESVTVALPALKTKTLGVEQATTGPQTIRPDARMLLVAGAGWTKKQSDGQLHIKDAEALIINFLEKTRASLGSSKSLVDQTGEGHEVISILTHLNQIGQTGSTPRHAKGLSTCCHGEEPHAVGWRFINERRAINLDANCGWAQGKADVVYIADAFAVMKRVNELL